ncbi:MAG: sigma-54-dependent Fis family transcriptional regulator, partial [Candidatus Hydrogenedentes bacterium]|nr:sigma-54-dependent Fis family transcriptional regulator [Candidatus Hydrogenedentota bacterium]
MDSLIPIIIVDDEVVVRETLCASLEGLNYEVRSCADGNEALAYMEQRAAHVVITDIMMPEMNGFELLRHIHKKYPQTVVVAITGFGTVEDAVRAMKEGAFDYVTKPFTIDQVRLVVARAARHYRLQADKEQLETQLRRSEELAFVGRLAAQVA